MVSSGGTLSGKGVLRQGDRTIATVRYTIHISSENGQADVVEFDRKLPVKDGDLVHLTLEDGRVVNCQVLGKSTYCAVVGDGPILERREHVR